MLALAAGKDDLVAVKNHNYPRPCPTSPLRNLAEPAQQEAVKLHYHPSLALAQVRVLALVLEQELGQVLEPELEQAQEQVLGQPASADNNQLAQQADCLSLFHIFFLYTVFH